MPTLSELISAKARRTEFDKDLLQAVRLELESYGVAADVVPECAVHFLKCLASMQGLESTHVYKFDVSRFLTLHDSTFRGVALAMCKAVIEYNGPKDMEAKEAANHFNSTLLRDLFGDSAEEDQGKFAPAMAAMVSLLRASTVPSEVDVVDHAAILSKALAKQNEVADERKTEDLSNISLARTYPPLDVELFQRRSANLYSTSRVGPQVSVPTPLDPHEAFNPNQARAMRYCLAEGREGVASMGLAEDLQYTTWRYGHEGRGNILFRDVDRAKLTKAQHLKLFLGFWGYAELVGMDLPINSASLEHLKSCGLPDEPRNFSVGTTYGRLLRVLTKELDEPYVAALLPLTLIPILFFLSAMTFSFLFFFAPQYHPGDAGILPPLPSQSG